ncbi:MAG: NifB/NifX family molybdenum-iron cluster-binding protein [Thermodesulfobacteriota bacterium]|jgi:predicted Fe-Mo cluster-binding NifX family protein
MMVRFRTENGYWASFSVTISLFVDAMVVGGIGAGALAKLNALGIKVYGAGALTVRENLALLSENKLQELSVDHACRAHQGGCGH